MADFFTTIYDNPHWVFIALGGTLLILELLGTGGYALWSGVSACCVGIIAWIFPISWAFLWILFAFFTIIVAYFWWRWLQIYQKSELNASTLNQPQKSLVGVQTIVVEAITNGRGRVKINDGTWLAKSKNDLSVGTNVKVIDVDGIVLYVEKTD